MTSKRSGRHPAAPGIRAMMTIFVTGTLLLVGVTLVSVLVLAVRPALLSGVSRRGDATARDAAERARWALAIGDTLSIRRAMSEIATDEEVHAVIFVDAGGDTVLAAGHALAGSDSRRGHRLIRCRAGIASTLDDEADVFSMESQGPPKSSSAPSESSVIVFMNAEPIYRLTDRWILVVASTILSFTIFLVRSVIPRVINPVVDLARAAERVSAGELGVRIGESAPAELGRLQSTFNRMVETLESQRQSLREKNAELETSLHRAEALNQELKQTQNVMVRSEKLRAIGEMASGIAHDFNNLLTAVLGRVQLMELKIQSGKLDSESLSRNLSIIRQSAEDGAQTVRRLQEHTRGALKTVLVPVDLGAIVQQVLDMTAPRWRAGLEREGKKIEAAMNLAPGSIVAGDESDLREVLLNLVNNAVDAMPAGGRLSFDSDVLDERIQLRVTDTGTGMDEDTQRRAFDPFFTTKGARGNGLGLSIVTGIVRRLGGRITLRSKPGEGTCFTADLKRWTGEMEVAPAAPPPRPGTIEPLPCLIVDDNQTALDNLRQILEHLGQSVTAADTGREACRLLADHTYAYVITDLGMPEVNGWEVARKAQAHQPDCRVVLCTGWGTEIESAQTQAGGVWRVLSKPYAVSQVRELLVDLSGLAPRENAA